MMELSFLAPIPGTVASCRQSLKLPSSCRRFTILCATRILKALRPESAAIALTISSGEFKEFSLSKALAWFSKRVLLHRLGVAVVYFTLIAFETGTNTGTPDGKYFSAPEITFTMAGKSCCTRPFSTN